MQDNQALNYALDRSTAKKHCVKSVGIRSFSGPYFPAFGLNTNQKNSECGHFLPSEGTSEKNNQRLVTNFRAMPYVTSYNSSQNIETNSIFQVKKRTLQEKFHLCFLRVFY